MTPTLSNISYKAATDQLTLTNDSAISGTPTDSGAPINTQAVSVNGLTPNTASLFDGYNVSLNGTASILGSGNLQLVSDFGSAGSAWSNIPLLTTQSFSITFSFDLNGISFPQADGIALALQSSGTNALGYGGGDIGYGGINGVVGSIIQTWSNNHVGLNVDGNPFDTQFAPFDLGYTTQIAGTETLTYNSSKNLLSMAGNINGYAVSDSAYINLQSQFGSSIYFGFTGGTGSGASDEQITSLSVSVTGVPQPTLSSAAYSAATGKLTLTGSHLTTAAASYQPADFSITGDGGTSYTLTGGSAVLGKPTSTSVIIQLSAADQLALDGLLNKNGSAANDGNHYSLIASGGWDSYALAVANVAVTASGVMAPTLSTVAYNAATGQLSCTGSHLVNHGGNNGINLADFTLSIGAAGTFAFNSSDSVSGLTGTGFTVSLSVDDQMSLNALLNGVSSGKLSALAGWDSDGGAAISAQTVKLPPQLGGVSYNQATGQLTLTGTNLTTTASGYQVGDFSLQGNGGGSYQLTSGSAILGTPTSTSVKIQLSVADQSAINALLNHNGTTASDGSAYNLTATVGWDTGAAAIGTAAVTATGVVAYSPLQVLGNGLSEPYSVTLDSKGNVWVASYGNSIVEEFSANGALLNTLSNGVSNPEYVAVDSKGNVFVANSGNNTVEEFSASGKLLYTLSNGVSLPTGLAVDSKGNVWVANNSNSTVEEFSGSGKLLQTLTAGVSGPGTLAIDRSGNVIVSNQYNNTVEKFSPSGTLLQTLTTNDTPWGVTVDSKGDVFVANYHGNTVQEFSASGTLLQTFSNGINTPYKVALDSKGDVFVANLGNNTVEEFSAGGALLQTLSSGVSTPHGLAVDGSGNVWVANFGNNTVEEFGVAPAGHAAVELLGVSPHFA